MSLCSILADNVEQRPMEALQWMGWTLVGGGVEWRLVDSDNACATGFDYTGRREG